MKAAGLFCFVCVFFFGSAVVCLASEYLRGQTEDKLSANNAFLNNDVNLLAGNKLKTDSWVGAGGNGWLYINTRQRMVPNGLKVFKQIVAVTGEATNMCIRGRYIQPGQTVFTNYSKIIQCQGNASISVTLFSDVNCTSFDSVTSETTTEYMNRWLADESNTVVTTISGKPPTYESFCSTSSDLPLPGSVSFATNFTYDVLEDCREARKPMFFESYRMNYCLTVNLPLYGIKHVEYNLPNINYFVNPECSYENWGHEHTAVARLEKCHEPGSYSRFYPEHNYPRGPPGRRTLLSGTFSGAEATDLSADLIAEEAEALFLAAVPEEQEELSDPYDVYYANYYTEPYVDLTDDALASDDNFDDDATFGEALPDTSVWFVSEWRQSYVKVPSAAPTLAPGTTHAPTVTVTAVPTSLPTTQDIFRFNVEQKLLGISVATYSPDEERLRLNNLIFCKVIASIVDLPPRSITVQSVTNRSTLTTGSTTAGDFRNIVNDVAGNSVSKTSSTAISTSIIQIISGFISDTFNGLLSEFLNNKESATKDTATTIGATKVTTSGNDRGDAVYVRYQVAFSPNSMHNSTFHGHPDRAYTHLSSQLLSSTAQYSTQLLYYSAQKSVVAFSGVSSDKPVVFSMERDIVEIEDGDVNVIAIVISIFLVVAAVFFIVCLYYERCRHNKVTPAEFIKQLDGSILDTELGLEMKIKPQPGSPNKFRYGPEASSLSIRTLSMQINASSSSDNNTDSASDPPSIAPENEDIAVVSGSNVDEVSAFDLAGLTIEAMEDELLEIKTRIRSKPPHQQELGEVGGPGGHISRTFYPPELNRYFI